MGAGVIRVGLSWSRTLEPRELRGFRTPAPAVDRGPNSRYSYSPASSLPTADSTALPSGDVRSHVRNSRRATATVSPSPRCPLSSSSRIITDVWRGQGLVPTCFPLKAKVT